MKRHSAQFKVAEQHYVKRTPASVWIWAAVLLGLFGLLAMLAIDEMVTRHSFLAVMALISVPLVLIGLVVGLRWALRFLNELKPQLRWYHGLWFLVFASALVFRIRGVGDIKENPIDAWALYRMGVELIVAAALFIRLALRRTPWLGSMFRGF